MSMTDPAPMMIYPKDAPRTEFGILGPLEVWCNGRLLRLSGLRQQKLLAILLLSVNVPVPYERLVDLLWDDPPRSTRQQIHNAVAGLRRALRPMSNACELITTENGYQIRAAADIIDASRFTAMVVEAERLERQAHQQEALALLQAAQRLWRGPALVGLAGRHIETVAARLNEGRLAAIERMMAIHLQLGGARALVTDLLELVAEHPYRESLRASLMEALCQADRQADALAVYEQGRQLLAENFGIDPGPMLRRQYLQVLQREGDIESGATKTEPGHRRSIDTDSTGLLRSGNYLPYDIREFIGREHEVEQLARMALAASNFVVIAAIDGMGGTGKTALAVHLAHRLSFDYPDGQYFVDLNGFCNDRPPLTSSQALEHLLLQTGSTVDAIPPDLVGRSALWRARLAGRRVLMLLDDAVDAAQVRPLIPGTGEIFVMVTSRRRLTAIEGAVPISLDALPQDDALKLFVQVAGEDRTHGERDSVATAVEYCGLLPLAVRIAAARFRARVRWTVQDLVEQLRDQRSRARFLAAGDRDVMAALALSYQQLSPDHQRMFRLLSLHPHEDLDIWSVAALTDVTIDESEYFLEALYDDNLLLQQAAGRYQFHDLVRDCSRKLLREFDDESTQLAATHRLRDYYHTIDPTAPTDRTSPRIEASAGVERRAPE